MGAGLARRGLRPTITTTVQVIGARPFPGPLRRGEGVRGGSADEGPRRPAPVSCDCLNPRCAPARAPQLEDDIAAKEKLLRASEDERDRVLEELHRAEDSLLAADETAAKVPAAGARVLICLSSLPPCLPPSLSPPLSLSF